MISIAEMQPGEIGRVIGFNPGDRAYRQKLLSMGLTPNTYFQVIRRAPLGDPIQIRVHAYHLSLRQSEAMLLKIERIALDES
jgi:ferrous iron transport protein A